MPEFAKGLAYSTLTGLNFYKSQAEAPCDVFTISKSDINVTGICHKKKKWGLYVRGLNVHCCPNWGLFVRGLYVRGLFDLDSIYTLNYVKSGVVEETGLVIAYLQNILLYI